MADIKRGWQEQALEAAEKIKASIKDKQGDHMRNITYGLYNWPKTKGGEYVFKATEEAYFFANLIYNKPIEIEKLRHAREKVRQTIEREREKANPNLDRMMLLAVKGQFYRECLEEVKRIKNEKYRL